MIASDKEHHLPHREGRLGRAEKQRTAVSVKSLQRQWTPPIEAGQFDCALESSAADVGHESYRLAVEVQRISVV